MAVAPGQSPFLKSVLIPFWIVRIGIMVVQIGVIGLLVATFAYANSRRDKFAAEFEKLKQDYNITNDTINVAIAIWAVQLALTVVCLVLELACIIKRGRRTLSPKFFLGVNILQTAFFTVLFVLAMIGGRNGLSIAVNVVCYVAFFGLLLYSIVIYHKFRRGTLYAANESYDKAEAGFVPHPQHQQYPQPPQQYAQPPMHN